MRTLVTSLLALSILLLGGGALSWVHDRAHEREDAASERLAMASSSGASADGHARPGKAHPPKHDESNCFLHAQLAAFVTTMPGVVPLLISLGLLVAFVTMLPRVVCSLRCAVLLDCRGPPAV